MDIRRISRTDAQRNFDTLMTEVRSRHRPVIVESDGQPIVAVVPIEFLRIVGLEDDAFFEMLRESGERVNLPEEEAMEVALREVADHRAEQPARTLN